MLVKDSSILEIVLRKLLDIIDNTKRRVFSDDLSNLRRDSDVIVNVSIKVRTLVVKLLGENLFSRQREDVQEFILNDLKCHSVARHIQNLFARIMNPIAHIEDHLTDLSVMAVVIVDEENILVIDVILGEVMNFSVKKIPIA